MKTQPSTTNIDPRPGFTTACAAAFDTIAKLRPEDLGRPTPCEDFDVAGLLNHLVTAIRRPLALALGESPFAQPAADLDVSATAWSDVFAAEMTETLAAWTDSAVLDQMMELPWAQLPGRAMLPTYTAELTVHTWDLAQAIGTSPEWTPSVIETAIEASAHLLPGGTRQGLTLPNGMPLPFADEVVVADSAAPIERLVAWYGRNPS